MKVKIFYGDKEEVEYEFNEWAKGKALTKNVIIHSVISPAPSVGAKDLFAIFVYYPEWIEEEKEEKQ